MKIKKTPLNLLWIIPFITFPLACDSLPSRESTASSTVSATVPSITPSTTPSKISLFNGQNLKGWHTDIPAADEGNPVTPSFIVQDGMLISQGSPGGHLITDTVYENYELLVEYRWAGEPGNCGILVHASTPRRLYGMFPQSIECQMYHGNAGDFWCIGEDITVEDMEKRRGPKDLWGVEEGQSRRILNLTDDSENPVGEWNTMGIRCEDDRITVKINGDLVNYGFDCSANQGNIGIQAEGARVEFRKLNLYPL
ncbi:DUF1080 domain-containing protein [Planctomycetota bacterium]|nr:DUF1080 domain-containing protein [Planctomycetota bacterium]